MSTFWEVTIRETGPDWVDLEVVRTHPDAGAFPEDPVFALCLLTQEAYKYEPTLGYNPIPRCPLGEAIPYDQSFQPFDVARRVDEFGCRVLIYETHNVPWDEATIFKEINKKVLAQGIDRASENWDYAHDDQWQLYWEDKNNLPRAVYRIWVTDPKWLQHLSNGMAFASAAYSEKGPWVNERRRISV